MVETALLTADWLEARLLSKEAIAEGNTKEARRQDRIARDAWAERNRLLAANYRVSRCKIAS